MLVEINISDSNITWVGVHFFSFLFLEDAYTLTDLGNTTRFRNMTGKNVCGLLYLVTHWSISGWSLHILWCLCGFAHIHFIYNTNQTFGHRLVHMLSLNYYIHCSTILKK